MLRELFLPARCASCKAEGRGPLCLACEETVPWISSPICARCGLPVARPVERCTECRERFAFASARAAARYEGPARHALKAFKLSGERRFAKALARPMLAAIKTIPAFEANASGVVTFVPATRRSVLERGFNPAEELARPLARTLKRPLRRLLAKTRETQDQAGLGRDARKANLASAFEAHACPQTVLLVDDVFTTGATADACAEALLANGAKQVNVVTFARAGRAGVPAGDGKA